LPSKAVASDDTASYSARIGEQGMVTEQRDRLESFRAFVNAAEKGAPIPAVAEDDLRRLHDISVDMAKRYVGKNGVVGVELMARVCRRGANLPAVWFRYTRLRSLAKEGVLAEWQHGTDFDDAVYRVAATIPMNGLQQDSVAFVQRLRCETPA
jgi:hypothetical protein